MKIVTRFSEETYFDALCAQNFQYGKIGTAIVRVMLIAAVFALTFRMEFIDTKTDWFIRAIMACVVVGVHAFVAGRSRKKMFTENAKKMSQTNPHLVMTYEFGEDGFVYTDPAGESVEVPYSAIEALLEAQNTYLISMGRSGVHAVVKSDLYGEERGDFTSLLTSKTGKEFKLVKI